MTNLTTQGTILAIDASTQRAAITLLQDGLCVASQSWPAARGTPGQLVKEMENMRLHANLAWEQLDVVLIGCGPGQYAGLRISVTAAQSLQLPSKGKVLGIASPHAILAAARNEQPAAPALIVCGDARRNHIWFYAWYARDPHAHPVMQCLPLETFASLPVPNATKVLSPDYNRLAPRIALPPAANWITGDAQVDPLYLLQAAVATPALIGPPEIQYVHPPVAVAPMPPTPM